MFILLWKRLFDGAAEGVEMEAGKVTMIIRLIVSMSSVPQWHLLMMVRKIPTDRVVILWS